MSQTKTSKKKKKDKDLDANVEVSFQKFPSTHRTIKTSLKSIIKTPEL